MESIQISPSNIYLFTANTNDPRLEAFLNDDYNFETAIRHLNLEQQAKIQHIKSPTLRRKRLATSLFTRAVLNCFIHQMNDSTYEPWTEVGFDYNAYGKPSLPNMHFNQSSSNDIIAVAISLHGPIGIDLSHSRQDSIDPANVIADFADIFHPTELDQLASIADTNKRYVLFNQCWTLKEAFTKLIGSGLHIDLKQVGFYLDAISMSDSDLTSTGALIESYHIKWHDRTVVTVEDELARHELVKSGEYHCLSACLTKGTTAHELPVIVSIIHQDQNKPSTTNCHIDMYQLLQHYN